MSSLIEQPIRALLKTIGIDTEMPFTAPPKPEMGDLALPCFDIAKKEGKNPVEVAKEIKKKLEIGNWKPRRKVRGPVSESSGLGILDKVETVGPFVNFFLNAQEVARLVLPTINESFGTHTIGKGKKIMVEFAHPNTHKAFHIGHLRNITTGESIIRLLENAGYQMIRVNYQGDVGMHIAKSLWGIFRYQKPDIRNQKSSMSEWADRPIKEKIAFLGAAYATGSKAYEEDEVAKNEIHELNKKIYARDPSIQDVYQTTRDWSLEYFEYIYARVGSRFDRLYFESEVYERGTELVKEFLEKGVFEKSDGAIIFPGSKYGLHDRVFITSLGFPGYEAKEMALGELQFGEYHPDHIIHVVGREQSGYFEVVFKALEFVLPESKGKETHLIYGWVHLKEGKMSSRTGNVVLGEWLLDEVKRKIAEQMTKTDLLAPELVKEKVAVAAVKYGFLKTGVSNDIAFDINESISTSGDSGPYLLYTTARINSILRKAPKIVSEMVVPADITFNEKKLLLVLAMFPEVTQDADETHDPSKVARYLFSLAQEFHAFYSVCPVLQAEEDVHNFRLTLIQKVAQVMTRGLYLLGIETVEEM